MNAAIPRRAAKCDHGADRCLVKVAVRMIRAAGREARAVHRRTAFVRSNSSSGGGGPRLAGDSRFECPSALRPNHIVPLTGVYRIADGETLLFSRRVLPCSGSIPSHCSLLNSFFFERISRGRHGMAHSCFLRVLWFSLFALDHAPEDLAFRRPTKGLCPRALHSDSFDLCVPSFAIFASLRQSLPVGCGDAALRSRSLCVKGLPSRRGEGTMILPPRRRRIPCGRLEW